MGPWGPAFRASGVIGCRSTCIVWDYFLFFGLFVWVPSCLFVCLCCELGSTPLNWFRSGLIHTDLGALFVCLCCGLFVSPLTDSPLHACTSLLVWWFVCVVGWGPPIRGQVKGDKGWEPGLTNSKWMVLQLNIIYGTLESHLTLCNGHIVLENSSKSKSVKLTYSLHFTLVCSP